jgi:hypothetical protein
MLERAQVGQYITVDPAAHPDLAGQRLLITEVIDKDKQGRVFDRAMLAVSGDQGLVTGLGRRMVRYIREDETQPAPAQPGERPRVVEVEKETVHMNAETKLLNLATTIAKTEGISLARAAAKASQQLTSNEIAEYRGGTPEPEARTSFTSRDVTERPGFQRLRAETQRVAREEGLSFEDAADKVLHDRLPAAGASRFELRVQQLTSAGLDCVMAFRRASQESPADAEAYRLAGL